MAFNWGNALRGGITGAITGFAVGGGPWGAAAGALAGGAMGGFSSSDPYSKLGSIEDVMNANPWSDAAYRRMLEDRAYSENWMRSAGTQAGGYGSRLDKQLEALQGFEFTNSYDPMAAQRAFIAGAPELQAVAQRSLGGSSGEEQARRLAAQATQSVASQFAGQGALSSGAAMKAMGEGAANPLAAYQAQREQLLGNLTGNLYGQSYAGLTQGYGTQAQFDMARQQAEYENLIRQAAMIESQRNASLSQQQLAAQQLQQANQGLAQYGAPMWWQPTYVANPDYMSPMDSLAMGAQMGSLAGNMTGGISGMLSKGGAGGIPSSPVDAVLGGEDVSLGNAMLGRADAYNIPYSRAAFGAPMPSFSPYGGGYGYNPFGVGTTPNLMSSSWQYPIPQNTGLGRWY